MKEPEIYWYETPDQFVIIGFRGGPEYKLPLCEYRSAYLREERKCWNEGRAFTEKDAIKLIIKESQYVDFEEVKPEIRLLDA